MVNSNLLNKTEPLLNRWEMQCFALNSKTGIRLQPISPERCECIISKFFPETV